MGLGLVFLLSRKRTPSTARECSCGAVVASASAGGRSLDLRLADWRLHTSMVPS